MYLEFYNLDTMPFENTPDPRFFYASEQHREALAAIEYSIRMRKGFVLITGAIGSGKTTVGRTMCQRCATQATIVTVMPGQVSGTVVLRQILRSLNVAPKATEDHSRLLERLRDQFLAHSAERKPIVLFVDEAQTLSESALEELRLLSNFDTTTEKLAQVVLVGQPELRQRIRMPRFDALRQRIVMAKQLAPLSLEETTGYIRHRVAAASSDPSKPGVEFTESTIREIHRSTGGIPRLINFTCDNCLLLGFVREARQITPLMVQRVMADMLPRFDEAVEVVGPVEAIDPVTEEDAPRLSLTGS